MKKIPYINCPYCDHEVNLRGEMISNDPMDEIREVHEKWKTSGKFSNLAANEMWAAIKKAVEKS